MARVVHTVTTVRSADPADLSSLGTSLNKALVAADTTNKEAIANFTGTEIILAFNSGAAPHTVTVDGVTKNGRAGSITAYSVGAGLLAIIALPSSGWKQTDGTLHFEANHAEIKFGVIRYSS